jgi:trk system potassium uptake protein TrkA
MRVVIVGCGRVGAALANTLSTERHDVRVVDRNAKAQRLLEPGFAGRFAVGNGYNRAVLEAAGIEHSDAFVAVTSGDNSNAVAARAAREEYHVPIVIARIYDPKRADIYRNLGIPTVASVRWTVNEIRQQLVHRHLDPAFTFGDGETLLIRTHLPAYLAGRRSGDLDVDTEVRVVEVTRAGRSMITTPETVLQQGDFVAFVVASTALERLRGFLGRELGT